MPTTYQYKHVWTSNGLKKKYKVMAHFQHDQLGISHVIHDCLSCTFLSFTYSHSTSICYLEDENADYYDDDGIIFMNHSGIIFMLAWGRSCGPAEYKRNSNIKGKRNIYCLHSNL